MPLRAVAKEVAKVFRLEHVPSHATISRDFEWVEKHQKAADPELIALLSPHRFPDWRARFFTAPETGLAYETPKHQIAWYWMLYALCFKEPIPKWVLDYLDLPYEVNDDIAARQSLLTFVLLAPPRHGKTELFIHGLMHLTLMNPNLRIIYCSGIKDTSMDNVDLIKVEFEDNEALVEAYGPFEPESKKWARTGLVLAQRTVASKTSTFHPIGKGSNVLSKDADIIIVDDPEDSEDAESEATVRKDYKWLTTNLMTRREPHTPVLCIGSYQPSETGDMWYTFKQNVDELNTGRSKVYWTEMKAHDYNKCDIANDPEHTKCVLWPTVRPYWFLEGMRGLLGDIMFEVCYNQDARIGTVQYFIKDILRREYVEPPRDEQKHLVPLVDNEDYLPGFLDRERSEGEYPNVHCRLNIPTVLTMGFDAASREKKKSSYTAYTVLAGCRFCLRRWIVDCAEFRQSPEKHPDSILKVIKKHKHIRRLRIEINAYQLALARDPRLTSQQGPLGFEIDEWDTDVRKNDPTLGVPTVGKMVHEGRCGIYYRFPHDQQAAEPMVKSLIRYPKEPNDLPMSLWLADLSMRELFEDLNNQSSVLQGWIAREDIPGYMDEYEVDMSKVYDGEHQEVFW